MNREWINSTFWPVAQNYHITPQDKLATLCTHLAQQIAKGINDIEQQYKVSNNKLLVTGGGAFNHYLINELRKHAGQEIVVPEKNTVNYKEALIFALLGALRLQNKNNCLQSVTGAERNNIGGAMYGNFSHLYTTIK